MENAESKILLSFVVPVYNVDKYLPACIDSIVLQGEDASAYEVILVDDGSEDTSGQVCDNYAQRYPNVVVLHKANGGVSSARNHGMQYATGKYLAFVDADDLIEKGSLSGIIEWIRKTDSDLCFLRGVKFFADAPDVLVDQPLDMERIRNKSPEEVLGYLSTQSKYPGSACMKLFRRDFVIQNNLMFPCDRRHGEDLAFMRDALLNAASFDALDGPYYRYRQDREDSCTHSISDKSFFDFFRFITDSICVCEGTKSEKTRYFMSFVAYEYLVSLLMYGSISQKGKKDAYALLKEYKWVLKYARSKTVYLSYYLCSLVGFRLASGILAVYKRLHR